MAADTNRDRDEEPDRLTFWRRVCNFLSWLFQFQYLLLPTEFRLLRLPVTDMRAVVVVMRFCMHQAQLKQSILKKMDGKM
jgi:hypothetical protein